MRASFRVSGTGDTFLADPNFAKKNPGKQADVNIVTENERIEIVK